MDNIPANLLTLSIVEAITKNVIQIIILSNHFTDLTKLDRKQIHLCLLSEFVFTGPIYQQDNHPCH